MNLTTKAMLTLFACSLTLNALAVSSAEGGSAAPGICAKCKATCPGCQLVECTVLVPTTVVETRMKSCVVYTKQEREETYTVFFRRPKKQEYTTSYWYLDDDIEHKEITEKRCQIVMNPVAREHNVQVPVRELRTLTDPEDGCAQSGKPEAGAACEQEVTVLRDQPQTCMTEQAQLVFQTNTCWIDICKKVPKQSPPVVCTKDTVYELVPKTETRTVVVCVPTIEKRPECVQVCKLLPQTILCCPACAKSHSRTCRGSSAR